MCSGKLIAYFLSCGGGRFWGQGPTEASAAGTPLPTLGNCTPFREGCGSGSQIYLMRNF